MIGVNVGEIEIPKCQKIHGKRSDDRHPVPMPDARKHFGPGAGNSLDLHRAHICLPVGFPFPVIKRHVCEMIQARSTRDAKKKAKPQEFCFALCKDFSFLQ
jgi:hypothetical protein